MARVLRWATALACTLVAGATAAQTVQRCEAADGRVTYSNTECPAGTQPVRKVNTDPPVRVDEQAAARARAKKDAAEAAKIDKEHAAAQARYERNAKDRRKREAKAVTACERARREVERARAARTVLVERTYTAQQLQKTDREIARREDIAARDCAS